MGLKLHAEIDLLEALQKGAELLLKEQGLELLESTVSLEDKTRELFTSQSRLFLEVSRVNSSPKTPAPPKSKEKESDEWPPERRAAQAARMAAKHAAAKKAEPEQPIEPVLVLSPSEVAKEGLLAALEASKAPFHQR